MPRLHILIGLAVITLASSCEELAERAWCEEICEKLRECEDNELGVGTCTDRCEEAVDEGAVPKHEAENCAECVDDHTCREVNDECSVCQDILPEFTSRRFQ